MNTKDDGGPAFPTYPNASPGGWQGMFGMSLRDWFAGMALQSIIHFEAHGYTASKHAARWAYDYADAMLAEAAKEKK